MAWDVWRWEATHGMCRPCCWACMQAPCDTPCFRWHAAFRDNDVVVRRCSPAAFLSCMLAVCTCGAGMSCGIRLRKWHEPTVRLTAWPPAQMTAARLAGPAPALTPPDCRTGWRPPDHAGHDAPDPAQPVEPRHHQGRLGAGCCAEGQGCMRGRVERAQHWLSSAFAPCRLLSRSVMWHFPVPADAPDPPAHL